MNSNIDSQHMAFDSQYAADTDRWNFHDTKDPLTRYLRDRRLRIALETLHGLIAQPISTLSVLVVCGGVGGEASYFLNRGFKDVTNTDFSESALHVCQQRDPRLRCRVLNAESMDLPDESFDLVVVQDGLHHLPRPVLGLNEMVRVARRAVVVLEPHTGLVARLLGTEWERHGDAVNYVFRWNGEMFRQVVLSQLLERPLRFSVRPVWDHNVVVRKLVAPLGGRRISLVLARIIYGLLGCLGSLGNNFIGVVVKDEPVN